MNDLNTRRETAARRNALAAQLDAQYGDGKVLIVHLGNPSLFLPAGAISVCTPALASHYIVRGSHRLATTEEQVAWESDQALRAREIAARTARMFGEAPVYVRARPR